MRPGLALVLPAALAALAALAAPARADYRDGCPAGAVPRRFLADQLGPAADRDSVLTPSRVELAVGDNYYTSRPAAPRARVYTFAPRAQYDLAFDDRHALVFALWGEGLLRLPDADLPQTMRWANTLGGVAVRWGSMTEVDVLEHVRIPTLREASALELIGGRSWIAPDPSSTGGDALILRELGVRSTFDGYLRQPGWVIGGAFETRYEIVGCAAPFFHFRVAPTISGIADAFQIWTLPLTAALGIAATSDASIYVQYGVAVRHYGNANRFMLASGQTLDLTGMPTTQRIRLGFDWHIRDQLHVGAHIDYASGQDGIFSGLYVAGGGDP